MTHGAEGTGGLLVYSKEPSEHGIMSVQQACVKFDSPNRFLSTHSFVNYHTMRFEILNFGIQI